MPKWAVGDDKVVMGRPLLARLPIKWRPGVPAPGRRAPHTLLQATPTIPVGSENVKGRPGTPRGQGRRNGGVGGRRRRKIVARRRCAERGRPAQAMISCL